jgi:hypothetical protein
MAAMHITWSVMRIAAIAIAVAAVAGCGSETLLRIDLGGSVAPTSIRLTLVGAAVSAAPRTIAPVSLPGTIVVRGLSPGSLCVQVEALDGNGAVLGSASANVQLVAHRTTDVALTLAGGDNLCVAAADMASPPPPPDLAGVDGGVVTCPSSALFCDDFESDNLTRWTKSSDIKNVDMGSIGREFIRAAHGLWSVEAMGSGIPPSTDNYIRLEKDLPAMSPPLAVRANFWTAQPLGNYTTVMSIYDPTNHGFSVGGDSSSTWVVTEDAAAAPDRHSDMVPAGGGGWHCVELVVDGGGNVTLFVDGHQLAGPWARATVTAYSAFFFGIERTAVAGSDVFVDDVAIGPTRLYCP